ncbi:hypothetical protein H5410_004903, partial [Solanum commersonii]
MGPTNKIVLELSNFIGTITTNPRFISLMYTSWYAVSNDTKKRMEYINSKFLIPVEGKKWVMTGLHNSWRRHKQKNKENFFDKNSTLEDMLAKCPDGIPDNQFCQLIEYWKHPTIQAELQNCQNFRETFDDAFRAVFGKEQHDRLRCYGCVGSNLASPVDASSAQAVIGTNLPHSSGSAHDTVLQK